MKKTSHLFFIFLPLFVSLFFFIPQVKADTTYTFYTEAYINEPNLILNAHNKAEDIVSNRQGFYYVILPNTGSIVNIYLFSSLDSYSFIFQHYNAYDCYIFKIYNSSNLIEFYNYNTSTDTLTYKSNKSLISQEFQIYSNNRINYTLLDTNYEMIYSDISSSFSISYDDTLYPIANDLNYLTLYDVLYSTPSVPSDNTPLLTSFVDIVIEKLTLVCNFFTSSYIYLSIFVIFIFYFVIYLLRRFK